MVDDGRRGRDHRRTREGGFTFIEIMVGVAILAILAALVVPRIMGRTDDAKRTAAKVQIRNIEGALQLYKLDNGVYPSTEQGLKALMEKPTVGMIPKKWKVGGYLPRLPEDPWGNPYKYLSPSQKGDYEVLSLGTEAKSAAKALTPTSRIGIWKRNRPSMVARHLSIVICHPGNTQHSTLGTGLVRSPLTSHSLSASAGFTLLEMLIVLFLLGGVLALVIPHAEKNKNSLSPRKGRAVFNCVCCPERRSSR